jgi:hypothetical protein
MRFLFFFPLFPSLSLFAVTFVAILFLFFVLQQVLKPEERTRLIENISGHLKDAQEFIQQRAVTNFSNVDRDFGRRLQAALDGFKKQVG